MNPDAPADPLPGAAAQPMQMPDWLPLEAKDGLLYLLDNPLLGAVLSAAFFYLVAKLAQALVSHGVGRLAGKTETTFDDQVVARLHTPVFLTVFLLGLCLAVQLLGLPLRLRDFTVGVLATLVILAWLTTAFPILRLVLDSLGRNRARFKMLEERTIPLFDMIGKLVLVGGASYAFLLVWGIDPTAWLASAGVIGIAVGFAAKDTLANLFSGFFIVADAPYKLGDFIILSSGERGRVTQVGIRSTRLLTRDDIEIILPNAVIANSKIINESGGPWEKERIRIKVGVAYGSDVDQVSAVLEKIAVEHAHICAEPEPRVRLRAFGASSLDFELLCWIDEPVLRGLLSHELHMEIYKKFAQLGIEIPYAKQDVYIKEMPGERFAAPAAAPISD